MIQSYIVLTSSSTSQFMCLPCWFYHQGTEKYVICQYVQTILPWSPYLSPVFLGHTCFHRKHVLLECELLCGHRIPSSQLTEYMAGHT